MPPTHKTITTPGIDLLLKCVVLYVLPTIIFILGFQRLIDQLDVLQALQLNPYLARGLPVLLGVSAFPSYAFARIFWREFKNRREAARLGARPIPKLRGKWFANVDFLQAMNKRAKSGYPGKWIPFTSARKLRRSTICADDTLTDLPAKYGPVADFYVLWSHLMFTTSPEYIKIILATDFANYEKGEEFNTVVSSLLGNGVFSSDGDMWKFHRSMTRPFFSRDRISHFDLFDRHADAVIAKIKERARASIAMDFQDLMGRFTLDSATEFLFGACVHSLQGETPFPYNHLSQAYNKETHIHPADEFARAFHEAQTIVARRERMGGLWPLTEFRGDRMKAPMKVVDAFINPIIEEAIRKKDAKISTDTEKEANPADVDEGETLLDHLVKFTSGKWIHIE